MFFFSDHLITYLVKMTEKPEVWPAVIVSPGRTESAENVFHSENTARGE